MIVMVMSKLKEKNPMTKKKSERNNIIKKVKNKAARLSEIF